MVSSDDGDHDEKKRVFELIGGTGTGKPPDSPGGVSITPFSRKIFEICMKFFDDILSKIDDPKEFRKVSSNFIREYSLCVKENFNNILSNDQNYQALKITHSACDTAFRIISFNEMRDLQRKLDITMIYLTIVILVLSVGSVWIAVDEKPIFISTLNISVSKEQIALTVSGVAVIVAAIVLCHRYELIQKLIRKMKKL